MFVPLKLRCPQNNYGLRLSIRHFREGGKKTGIQGFCVSSPVIPAKAGIQ
jgi:hypothetical protein